MAAFLYFQVQAGAILLILLANLFHSLAIYCHHSPSHFKVQPRDKTAKEGGSASFTCTSRNFNSQTDTLSWQVVPNLYAVNEKKMFNSSSQEMISTITVRNIGKTNQYFSCNLNIRGHEDQQETCFASRKASLFVQYFPDRDELTCNPKHPLAVKEGQTLRIMCEVSRGEPAVDLSWRFSPPGANDQHLPTHQDDGAYRVLSHALLVTRQLHLKEIICGVTSDLVFPGIRHQCSIGPITVLYPPHVFVQPRQARMTLRGPTQLSCIADGHPEHFNFSWSCFPEGVLGGCDGKDQRANLHLSKASDISNIESVKHISVTCTVTNSEGSGMGSSHITIADMHLGNAELDSFSCEDNVKLNVTMDATKGWSNSSYITFVCAVTSSSERCKIQKILWYLGNSSFSENENEIVEGKLLSQFSVGIARIYTNENQALHCEVSVSNTTVRSSFNLSQLIEKQQMVISGQSPKTDSLTNPNSSQISKARMLPDSILDDISNDKRLYPTIINKENIKGSTDSPRSSALKIWQIVTITVAGVLVTVILTACVVTILSMCMYKRFFYRPSTDPKSSHSKDDCKDRYSISSNLGPIYDEPHVPSPCKLGRCKSLPDIAKDDRLSLNHIYDSNVYHSSYISTSSDSSWSSCTDSDKERRNTYGTPSSGSSDQGLSCMAKYRNGEVVQMELERRHTLGHDVSLKKPRQKLTTRMPPPPLTKNM